MHIRACCCWDSLRTGSKAAAVFTFVTGIINIIIDIYLLYTLHYLDKNLEINEKIVWLMPGILVFMYLELAFNFALLGLALVLNVGINQGHEGQQLIRVWTGCVIGFRGYEGFLGIYILAWLGGFRVPEIVYIAPETIVVAFYWILNTILLAAAIICVRSYWRELLDDVYGKERRTKYLSMLANIRTAARGTGTVTPVSYWSRSRATSHMSLAQPHPSYGPGYSQHPSQSSYSQHPSQSSYGHPQGGYPHQQHGGYPQHQQHGGYPQHQQQAGYHPGHPPQGGYHPPHIPPQPYQTKY